MLVSIVAFLVSSQWSQPPANTPALAEDSQLPFSFYKVPSDVVGFKDCPEGFQLTYDGSLNNGFGELSFSVGSELKPVNQRIKTLAGNRLPIPQYQVIRDGIQYDFKFIGYPAGGDPRSDLVAHVLVGAKNTRRSTLNAVIEAQYHERGGHGRAAMPCTPWYRDRFMDLSQFSAKGVSSVSGGKAWRNEHLVFCYDPSVAKELTNDAGVRIEWSLKAGESKSAWLKVPYVPISSSRKSEISKVVQADSAKDLASAVHFWMELMSKTTQIELPDPKVVDTLYASLAYLLIARDIDEDGKTYIQKVNEFQYDDFYPRDTAYIARTYDMMNLPEIARQTIDYYLVRNSQGQVEGFKRLHPDDWGQSLWAMGSHYRMTRDKAFAELVYSGMPNHVKGYEQGIASDPLRMFPATIAYDNELINGHYTGHNFWCILGLNEAENLARDLGHQADALKYADLKRGHRDRLLAILKSLTDVTGGYIPPGLDDPKAGFDWENATGGVYPFGILTPNHPWVTSTVRTVREYKWREGISTWGPNGWTLKQSVLEGKPVHSGSIHHYQTFNVDEVLLARGEQREVIEDLYSVLAHTSSTHAGFEMSMDPWGDRDPQGNYPPHGWFAARYVEMVRNMLVREEGGALHLASALAPDWMKPGKSVSIKNAPTYFGKVSYIYKAEKSGATVILDNKWTVKPTKLILHTPFFVTVKSASADGKAVPVSQSEIAIPINSKKVRIEWARSADPKLSFEEAVRLWIQKNYKPKPGENRDFLFPHPTRPRIEGVGRCFVDSAAATLVNSTDMGRIVYTVDGSEPTLQSPEYRSPIALTQDTVVKAMLVWPDGRTSEPPSAHIRKVEYREPVSLTDLKPGLRCDSWFGKFERLPDFTTKPDSSSRAETIDLAKVEPRPDFFALRLTGYIDIPKDGVYSFTTGSDDGSRLWIGDELVVNNDGLHSYQEAVGDIALRKGIYPISVAFFNTDGARYLRVYWEGPGFARASIPASALRSH